MKLQVDPKAVRQAVCMLHYAVDKNQPGGFSIMFNTIRWLLDDKQKQEIVAAITCSRHTSMLAVLGGVIKDLLADGFNIQNKELQKAGLGNAKVLQILLDHGLKFTVEDVKDAVGLYKASGKTLKMLCKVCPEAQREISQPLLDEYFCEYNCIQTKGELACEILDPNEAAAMMGSALAKAFSKIEKRLNDEVTLWTGSYSGEVRDRAIIASRERAEKQKANLAERLHKLVNRIPNWKKCREEILQNTTNLQVAALLAAELEGTS